jgi:hypothetical protein
MQPEAQVHLLEMTVALKTSAMPRSCMTIMEVKSTKEISAGKRYAAGSQFVAGMVHAGSHISPHDIAIVGQLKKRFETGWS